jgi:hypothetical protein
MEIGALAVLATAWVAVLAVAAFELLRARPLPARRRMLLYGNLLTSTCAFANIFLEVVAWPHSQRRIRYLVLVLLGLAGLVMVIRGGTNWGRRHHSPHRSPEL